MNSRGASTYMLTDLQGAVLAYDRATAECQGDLAAFRSLQDVIEPTAADELLTRVAEGEVEVKLSAQMCPRLAASAMCEVEVRRLESHDGSLALVILHPSEQEPAPDALTGLPDRRAIVRRLAAWQNASQRRLSYAVLFIDLDNFKQINDDYGHAVGDQVLAAVADRLARCVREDDLAVRYGGDEFVVLLKDLQRRQDVAPVVERIRRCIAEPINVDSRPFQVNLTVGVALVADFDVTIEEAIRAADRDMYAQKRRPPE
jgi:diguanylate cyclase (GGDEF)-like protein